MLFLTIYYLITVDNYGFSALKENNNAVIIRVVPLMLYVSLYRHILFLSIKYIYTNKVV